jgi:hypothetical protein
MRSFCPVTIASAAQPNDADSRIVLRLLELFAGNSGVSDNVNSGQCAKREADLEAEVVEED